jgi:hypothetical protein
MRRDVEGGALPLHLEDDLRSDQLQDGLNDDDKRERACEGGRLA